MARTVERIEKDLAALEETLGAIAQEFEQVYTDYLQDLSEAVSRQLILATYHLCTQGYPEPFLALSLQQRQDLQQGVRRLANTSSEQLLALLHPPEETTESEVPAPEADLPFPGEEEQDEASDEELPLLPPALPAPMGPEEMMALLTMELPIPEPSSATASDDPLNRLVQWQQRVEEGIVEVLHRLSHGTNRILHQAHVLPHQLPEPVLEVAVKSGMMTEPTPGSPNLINLVIESQSEEKKASDVIRVVAIRLRLPEVEFANPILSNWRSRLRAINGRLSQVGKDYRKNQKERAIAQAELAWRSSWYED
ncbi:MULTISPECIES: hypothetical protein [unclassified Leptolyngbya]|uniref:hypothetical protein n=1 Tax=unclassified Leptolyngbya TaxID=2650499 RepID=UPI0016834380|nr:MULTISPECIES: hypothetical protein [unclassified Leptolyngbya]MBD1912473.1 hypothetical protein [Leptolyngbya sp. FACHB-8]MBD2156516.1 hypothetical protein [Leptolyngbya sp. FACHB-16]